MVNGELCVKAWAGSILPGSGFLLFKVTLPGREGTSNWCLYEKWAFFSHFVILDKDKGQPNARARAKLVGTRLWAFFAVCCDYFIGGKKDRNGFYGCPDSHVRVVTLAFLLGLLGLWLLLTGFQCWFSCWWGGAKAFPLRRHLSACMFPKMPCRVPEDCSSQKVVQHLLQKESGLQQPMSQKINEDV